MRSETHKCQHFPKKIPIYPIIPIFKIYFQNKASCSTFLFSQVEHLLSHYNIIRVDLPGMNLDWNWFVSFVISGFRRLAKIFETTFSKTLQSEIGLNWLRDSGTSPFGIRHIKASFRFGRVFPKRNIWWTTSVILAPMICPLHTPQPRQTLKLSVKNVAKNTPIPLLWGVSQ